MKIAVLGSYATQVLVNELKKANNKNKYYESEHDQIDQEIINQNSGLYKFNPEIIIIHETLISFKNRFYNYKGKLNNFNNHSIIRLKMLCSNLEKSFQNIKIIYTTYDLNCDLVYGNYYPKVPNSFDSQLFLFQYKIINFCSKRENLFLLDINQLALNHDNYRDERMLINFNIHFSISFTKVIAKNLNNLINTINGHFIKCVILDLDNTIWGGSIGEDGLKNIEIGHLGIGKAFSNLQIWLKSLKNRGIILCVCSKNDETVAKEPFIKHSEMILKLEDITIFVANWKNKVKNIMSIKNILNIDFSSMVFLDDSSFERNLIKDNISQIIVPSLPEDPSEYLSFLQSQNLFEISNYSNLDKERTKLYQIEDKRQKSKASNFNITHYLKNLRMKAIIDNINNENIPRVHQLIQRSNQFNSRTIRYEKSQIINLLNDDEYLTYVISLNDNYGNNGIIACVILKMIDQKTIFLDTLVMSCRVFNRGVEFFLIDFLKKELLKGGIKFLMLEWIPSKRNILIDNFYRKLGYVDFKNKKETKELEYIPVNKFYIKLNKGERIEKRKNINPT